MHRFVAALATLVVLVMAGAASAQVVTVQQTSATSTTFGIANGFETRGQTLPVPAGVTRLQSFTLRLSGDVTPVVRQYDAATNSIGPVLFTGTPHSGGQADVTTTIPGGLAVTPGEQLFIGATQSGPGASGSIVGGGTGDAYPDGLVADLRGGVNFQIANRDLYFVAVFGQEPAGIPTLSEWALILLGVMLAGGAAFYVQRRQLPA